MLDTPQLHFMPMRGNGCKKTLGMASVGGRDTKISAFSQMGLGTPQSTCQHVEWQNSQFTNENFHSAFCCLAPSWGEKNRSQAFTIDAARCFQSMGMPHSCGKFATRCPPRKLTAGYSVDAAAGLDRPPSVRIPFVTLAERAARTTVRVSVSEYIVVLPASV